MGKPDVIIVGGGVVGCAVAYFLAREGVAVSLVERDDLASHASGAAAGMLAPICESTGDGPFFEFGLHGLALLAELAGELREQSGVDPHYVPSGVLRVAQSAEEARHLRSQAERLSAHGTEWLAAEAAQEREPGLADGVHGALWSPREGHVYSPYLARAYAGAAARLGARITTGYPALALLRNGDRVTGVETAAGPLLAGHVVLCAGVWTRFCAQWLGQCLPVEPVRGQILSLEAPRPAPRSIVWGDHVYLVPKQDGSLVVGATVERVGFDCRVTSAGVAELLDAAIALVPALGGCSFRRAWAGLRPDTPDHLPAIGPLPGVEGLTVAAGHFRNGVLLSAATGQLVADRIVRGHSPPFAQPFLPERLLTHPA